MFFFKCALLGDLWGLQCSVTKQEITCNLRLYTGCLCALINFYLQRVGHSMNSFLKNLKLHRSFKENKSNLYIPSMNTCHLAQYKHRSLLHRRQNSVFILGNRCSYQVYVHTWYLSLFLEKPTLPCLNAPLCIGVIGVVEAFSREGTFSESFAK